MKTGEQGIDLIKEFEELRLEAYLCPAGIWTIGYGHTGADVHKGLKISQAEADKLLVRDLAVAELAVDRLGATLRQNQFDALVSLAFNIGAHAFTNSTVARLVKQNPDHDRIADVFKMWNKSKGRVLAGLVRRRQREAELYVQ